MTDNSFFVGYVAFLMFDKKKLASRFCVKMKQEVASSRWRRLTPATPNREHAASNASSSCTHELILLPSLEPLRRTGHLWRRARASLLSSARESGVTAARPAELRARAPTVHRRDVHGETNTDSCFKCRFFSMTPYCGQVFVFFPAEKKTFLSPLKVIKSKTYHKIKDLVAFPNTKGSRIS